MENMVSYRVQDGTALIMLNNPPVNALGGPVLQNLKDAFTEAVKDKKVRSIVLYGKNIFSAGADINQFKNKTNILSGTIQEVINMIDRCSKPVIAAICGVALGGGFELAIACHYRLAKTDAIFGFPEVELGLLPAGAGTQLFPRLVGLKVALDMISTGRRITAKEALSLGAIDKVISGDLIQEAIKFAHFATRQSLDDHRTSQLKVKDTEKALELRDEAVEKAQRRFRGQLSPSFCIKSVMAVVDFPYEKGLEKEREYFNILLSSGQAKALQYAFSAQRAATKWHVPGLGNYRTAKPKTLKTGAVIGAGTMGSGIAMAMLNAGMSVVLIEQDEKFLNNGIKLLRSLYDGSVKLNHLTADEARTKLERLKPSLNYNDLRHVDIVIEAVYENLDLKRNVFSKLDQICKPDALLCSNTSTLSIDQIAEVTSRPDKVIGTHFFVPAYYMKLLENIRGKKTSSETIATAHAFGVKLGKVPVLVGNCEGFAANRMRSPLTTEAIFMLEEGCLPRDIDQVAEDFGFAVGPLKAADLTGLDTVAAITKERAKRKGHPIDLDTKFINGERVSALILHLTEHGRHGCKNGKGFYHYEKPYSKEPFDDPWMSNFLKEYCQRCGIERRKISPQEILERLLYASINEGFKIMEEGICTRVEELDTMWLLGFRWPRYHGGPMFYANLIGLDKVYKKVCYYYDKHPNSPHWQPARLMQQLAVDSVPFSDWNKRAICISSRL